MNSTSISEQEEEQACAEEFAARHSGYGLGLGLERYEAFRRANFSRLTQSALVFLDHAGTALYAQCQLDAIHAMLAARVLGNPHTHGSASSTSTRLVEEAREAILHSLGTNGGAFSVIFTFF